MLSNSAKLEENMTSTSESESAQQNGAEAVPVAAPTVEEQLENMRVSGDGAPAEEEDDDIVNPWNVCGKSETGIDYDKLISNFLKTQIPLFML